MDLLKNNTIIREGRGYRDTQNYILDKIAKIATQEKIEVGVKIIPRLAKALKEVEEIGYYDHWHGDRPWSYTIADSNEQLKITADSGRDIKLIFVNYN